MRSIVKGNEYNLITVILCFIVVIISGCISVPTYPKAEMVFADIPQSGNIKGNVDFVGLQIFHRTRSYDRKPLYSGEKKNTFLNYDEARRADYIYSGFIGHDTRELLLLFISRFNIMLQSKIHVYKTHGGFCQPNQTGYTQVLRGEQIPIYDKWDSTVVTAGGPGRMDNECLFYLKKSSTVDYFLIFSIRPLEVQLYSDRNDKFSMTVALIETVYDKEGVKIYSKVYKEKFEEEKDPEKNGFYYKCSKKLIEQNIEQINKDLSFILSANDAQSPNIEDLAQELTLQLSQKK